MCIVRAIHHHTSLLSVIGEMPQAWLHVHYLHQDLALPKRDRVASVCSPMLGPVFFGNANSFFSHLDAARSALCASTLSSTSLLPRAPALAGRACWHNQRCQSTLCV